MITFDDIPEAKPSGPPVETDTMPNVGEVSQGRRVTRVKAISAVELTKYICWQSALTLTQICGTNNMTDGHLSFG